MANQVLNLHGEGLIAYIQRTLLLREHVSHSLTVPSSVEQIFVAALTHFPQIEAPTVVTMSVPQPAVYWFHTGRRAFIVLAQQREEDYRQGVMLLGYHLLAQIHKSPVTPAICSPFESTLWRAPAFFWPRFFYHCVATDGAGQQLRQTA